MFEALAVCDKSQPSSLSINGFGVYHLCASTLGPTENRNANPSRRIMSAHPVLRAIGFVALSFTTASAAQADTVVLQASGPSAANYRQGTVLDESRQIELVQGDSLRLLVSGQSLLLQGPYSGLPRHSAVADSNAPTWDGVLRAKPRSRGAAVRGFLPASPVKADDTPKELPQGGSQ